MRHSKPAATTNGKFKSRPEHMAEAPELRGFRPFNFEKKPQVSPLVSVEAIKTLSMPSTARFHPYQLCTLIIPKPTSKDQRWIIKYYAWDALQEKKRMFRILTLNTIPDLTKRKLRAKQLILEINKKLKAGNIYNPNKAAQQRAQQAILQGNVITATHAIQIFLQHTLTLRPRTHQTYAAHIQKFHQYLQAHHLSTAPLNAITQHHIQQFLYNQLAAGLSHRTHNNYLNTISTLFQHYLKKEIIPTNPCRNIKPIKTDAGKNTAYLPHQQKQLMQFAKKWQPGLHLFSQFMYYTLARTSELASLKAQNIDLQNHKIYLSPEHSKNRQQRYITIPPQLYQIIKKLQLKNLDHYLFSNPTLLPGPKPTDPKRIGQYYRERILTKLQYPSGYTLYSWKHTGVISAYRAGLSPAAIRMQTGHTNTQSFEAYLHSLGLFQNTEVLTNYPSLPR